MIACIEDCGEVDECSPKASLCYLEWQWVNLTGSANSYYGALVLSTSSDNTKCSFFGAFGAELTAIKYNSVQFHSFGTLDKSSSQVRFAFVREPYNPSNPDPNTAFVWYRNCDVPTFSNCEEREVSAHLSTGSGDAVICDHAGVTYLAKRSPRNTERVTLIKKINYVKMAIGSAVFADSESVDIIPHVIVSPMNNSVQVVTLLKVIGGNGQSEVYDITTWRSLVFQDLKVQTLPDRTEQIIDAFKLLPTQNPEPALADWPIHIRALDSKVQISSALCSSTRAAEIFEAQLFSDSPVVSLSRGLNVPDMMVHELHILQELEKRLPYHYFTTSFRRPMHVLFEYVNLEVDALNHYRSTHDDDAERTTFHVFAITPASQNLVKPAGVYKADGGELALMHRRREAYVKYVFTDILASVFAMHSCGFVHRMIAHHSVVSTPSRSGDGEKFFKLTDLGQTVEALGTNKVDMRPLFQHIDPLRFFHVNTPDYLCPDYIRMKVHTLYGEAFSTESLLYSAEKAKMYDVWCLGVLLYFIVTVEAPAKTFERLKKSSSSHGLSAPAGLAQEYAFIFGWIDSVNDIIDFLRQSDFSLDIYDDLFDLLKNMLAAEPEKRYNLQQVMSHRWVQSLYHLPAEYPTRQQLFAQREGHSTTRNKRSRVTRDVSIVSMGPY
eukprot:gene31276-37796_t